MGKYSFVSNQIGIYNIRSEGIDFVSDIKPEMSFQFDFIFYEPDANNYFYFYQNNKIEMTSEQKKECLNLCKNYINDKDYNVFTYNNYNIFSGEMLKSKATEEKLLYCYSPPEYPVSKWNGKNWENVVLIVKNDGSIIKNPAAFCEQCIAFFTERELENIPDLLKYDDKYHKWDIENNEWIVVGDEFKDLSKELELKIREIYEVKRWKLYGKYTPNYERDQWNTELKESYEYLKDKNSDTPYIDGILSVLTNKISKEDYIQKILKHDTKEFKFEHGKIHGELYNHIDKLRSIKTLDELKVFQREILNIRYDF